MNDNSYNGWTNYETWNWKLWMDNDQGQYEYWANRVQELNAIQLIHQTGPYYGWQTESDVRLQELADELKQDCESQLEMFDFPTAGPFTDILNAGLQSINWREIAESLLGQ